MTWRDLGIDSRIISILEQFDYEAPFKPQTESIPALLDGKDVFVHSRTGTGKTIVILVSFLQFLARNPAFKCVILQPTHELVAYTYALFREALELAREVNLSFIASQLLDDKSVVLANSNLIVSTPFLLSKQQVKWAEISYVVIDEADLMFQMMQNTAAAAIMRYLPARTQKLMLSATLSEDVDNFSKFALRDPVVVSLAVLGQSASVQNYYLDYNKRENKFLKLYCLTKLKMLAGNIIIFAKSQRSGYRLSMFLEAFSLRSTVFDPKMPYETRLAYLESYNETGGILIVAGKSDEVDATRGLDFNQVDFVICFDCPYSFEEYQHAIGRCARGLNSSGSSYLFINSESEAEVLTSFYEEMQKSGATIDLFAIDQENMTPFAYRIRDVYNKLTSQRVDDAISAQVKRFLLKSDYAKKVLDTQENQRVLRRIRHPDIVQVNQLPDYLYQAAKALYSRQVVGSATRRAMQQASHDRRRARTKHRKAIKARRVRTAENWKRNNGRIEAPAEQTARPSGK